MDDRVAAKRLLAEGHVLEACNRFEQGLRAHPGDPELRHGMLLARSRATPGAALHRELDQVLAGGDLPADWRWQFLAIKARILKAEGEREPACLAEAAALYREAWELSGDFYPGVNAASLLFLCGRTEVARELAAALMAQMGPARGDEDYWQAATRGELALLLGREDTAHREYERADRLSAGIHGDRASIRRQLRLLASAGAPLARQVLATCFAQPRVLVFSGHRLDDESGSVRFAPSFEGRVADEMRRLAEGASSGFSSAASGGDILFAEAMLAVGAAMHVVLPVPAEQFVEVSVAPAGPDWVARFERVLASAARVVVAHHASRETPAVLFAHANTVCDGLAHLHADAVDGALEHCALLSPHAGSRGMGGTRDEYERWQSRGYRVRRLTALDDVAASGEKAVRAEPQSAVPRVGPSAVMTLVFADLVGSTQTTPERQAEVAIEFLGLARAVLDRLALRPLFRNTWGDALLLAFDAPDDAARFATSLACELGNRMAGSTGGLSVRVAVHTGPVERAEDPILGRANVFGHHVVRAARVEPVTPPGAVFATEEAAAVLRATGQRRFDCAYMGRIAMPKGFGQTPIYRIDALD